jgi:hypothetical protein
MHIMNHEIKWKQLDLHEEHVYIKAFRVTDFTHAHCKYIYQSSHDANKDILEILKEIPKDIDDVILINISEYKIVRLFVSVGRE